MRANPDLDAALLGIRAGLRPLLPERVALHIGGGSFNANELRRHANQAPAVVLTCLALGDYRSPGPVWTADASLAAYIITRDAPPGPDRHRQALTLTSALFAALTGDSRVWGNPEGYDPPSGDSLAGTNLYSGDLDSIATALWAVTWFQRLRFANAPQAATPGATGAGDWP